jgi:MoaA/NifB/PqqE/SkfB family radical SAM enzyme
MTNPLMTLDELTSHLHQTYSVVDFIDLNHFSNPGELYDRVLSLKKETFQDNERIVCVYSNNKIKFLLEILEVIDIPSFFLIVLTNKELLINGVNVLQYAGEYVDNNVSFDLSPSHCIYPWINTVIFNTGKIDPCVQYKSNHNKTIINTRLKDFYTSKEMTDLRNAFRRGEYPEGCSTCWKNESSGIVSTRQHSKFKLKDLYYRINFNQEQYQNLQMLDLKLGNACNLSCRICKPSASSRIADLDVIHNRLSKEKYFEIKQAGDWPNSDSFWEEIASIANNLTYLDILGGEPLLSKKHFNFLQYLINAGVAKHIKIDYNSNGTLYSEKFFDYWRHFKGVKISFSIDNIGDRFELERNGAKWETVCNNIKKFISKNSTTFITDVFPTVSILNVYYLPELVSWINAQKFSEPHSVNMLSFPNHLAINNLPNDVKLAVANKLKSHKEFLPIIDFMMQPGTDMINETKEYIKILDLERSQNFAVTHRDFANLIAYT